MTELPGRRIAAEIASGDKGRRDDIIVGGDDLIEAGGAKVADLLRIYMRIRKRLRSIGRY
jgi:hypothetical protein